MEAEDLDVDPVAESARSRPTSARSHSVVESLSNRSHIDMAHHHVPDDGARKADLAKAVRPQASASVVGVQVTCCFFEQAPTGKNELGPSIARKTPVVQRFVD